MERDYGIAANAAQSTYNEWRSRGAEVIREESLRNKADETDKHLNAAHALLDELESALHGPQPRGGQTNGNPSGDPNHPGLRAVLSTNSERAAALVGRLQTLINTL